MAKKLYRLRDANDQEVVSSEKGLLGGYRGSGKHKKLYGRLDCPTALRAIKNGGYVSKRVFFADEETAIAAGYRPCAHCLPEKYKAWKDRTAGS